MKESPAPVPGAVATHKINRLAAPAAIAACVALFYWAPMTLGARHASPARRTAPRSAAMAPPPAL